MRADVNITLVNPRPKFVERIRLHQHVAGNYDATVDYGTLLGAGVALVVDSATRIDTAARKVELASGGALDYDYVIYAVGSTGATPASVPGAAEFAYPIAELELGATVARRRSTSCTRTLPITVVGAGLTGSRPPPSWPSRAAPSRWSAAAGWPRRCPSPGRRSVAKWLRQASASPCSRRRRSPRCGRTRWCWPTAPRCPASSPSGPRGSACRSWPRAAGCSTDALGRLLTDETLTSVDDPRIVAAGDCRRPVGPAAADELPGRRTARRAGRQHRAEPHRRHPARRRSTRPSWARASAWAGTRPRCSWPARTTPR